MRFRKTVAFLALFTVLSILALSIPATALAAQSGDFQYNVVGGTVEITRYTGRGGAVTVPATIGGKKVIIIGESAFKACDTITSIVLPNGIVQIGDSAFSYCDKLTSVTIPNSVTSMGIAILYECKNLTTVTLPDQLKIIPDFTFSQCEKLSNVTIPKEVTVIGTDAFMFCYALKNVEIPSKAIIIEDNAFSDCTSLLSVAVPATVTSIGDSAFEYCSSMTAINVGPDNKKYCSHNGALFDKNGLLICCPAGKKGRYTIPDGTTEIGGDAFCFCKGLTDIAIPTSVVAIDDGAFTDCTGLTEINLPEGLETVEQVAFFRCTSLKKVMISSTVNQIDASVFEECTNLQSFVVNPSNLNYTSRDGVLFGGSMCSLTIYPKGRKGNYVIPSEVSGIDDRAFYDCSGLTGITIPSSVGDIGWSAFGNCVGLVSITIPDGIYDIGDYAFAGCTGIKTVTIPKSVSWIGECALQTSNYSVYSFDQKLQNGKLASINVDPANETYSSRGGVLFDKAQTTLICYPSGKEGTFIIPDGVQIIQDWAFTYSIGLTSVTLPKSIQSIGRGSFYDCKSLANALFRGTAPTVVDGTFYGETTGFKVYYPVSQEKSWVSFDKYITKQAYCIATLHPQNGSAAAKVMTNVTGGHIASPAAPARMGYSFGGWYKEAACINAWNFPVDIVKGDISLYARWVPPAPANVTASSVSYNSLRISWKPVGSPSGYEVYRASSASGAYSLAGSATAASFEDTGLTAGRTYYYKVRAYTLSGAVKTFGAYSAVASAKPVPAPPASVKAAGLSGGSIGVTWGAVAGATKYEVWRCTTSPTGSFILVTTTANLSYTNTGLTAGKTYWYKVRAYRLVGSTKVYGDFSTVVNAKP